jgi:hypothetical protein
MFRRIAFVLAFALALSASAALPPGATTGTGDEAFLRNAVLRVERHHVASLGGTATFEALVLSASELARLHNLLLRAFHRNRAEEIEAARSGTASGGVPGCISFEHRLAFTRGSHVETAWLHLCGGWVAGGPLVGQIVFTASETQTLEALLGHCKSPCP